MKTIKIKDLKYIHPLIYKRALKCQIDQGNRPNVDIIITESKYQGNFTWDETDEGDSVWGAVSIRDFEMWYNFHELHRSQILIDRYSIF